MVALFSHAAVTLMVSLASLLMQPERAVILFAGDAMQHQRQLDAARRSDASFDYSECFAAVKPCIQAADYAVVNLETPLGGAPYSGYPMFCAPDAFLDALTDAGFDFFLGANNHALDRRDRGVRRTVDQFVSRRLPFAGIYRTRAERDTLVPRIVDVNGFRIAMLNYTYGTNGIEIREDVVVDPIDSGLIERDIKAARSDGAELVAVCLHWGDEYQLLPNASQKRLADRLLERDVDMIVGSHPHVIQPVEMRRNPLTGRNQLLIYSLGNFISAMRTTDTRGGAAVEVSLSRDDAGIAQLDTATVSLFFTVAPRSSKENFRLVPAFDTIRNNPEAERQRRAFVDNAMRIYSRHNRRIGIKNQHGI